MSGQKNCRWIWISVDRGLREYVDFFLGNRGTETGKKLWKKVKVYAKGIVMTDYWRSYKEMIPVFLYERKNNNKQSKKNCRYQNVSYLCMLYIGLNRTCAFCIFIQEGRKRQLKYK